MIDPNVVVEIFMGVNRVQETTAFLLEALKVCVRVHSSSPLKCVLSCYDSYVVIANKLVRVFCSGS